MDEKHLNELLKNPNLIDSFSPREFEELIALLLGRFGWAIELTPQTRDGGVDIFATTKDETGLDVTWIVECKKYASDRKIGVDILRGLHGAKKFLGVSNGILATTSSFAKDATDFASKLYLPANRRRSQRRHTALFKTARPHPKRFRSHKV